MAQNVTRKLIDDHLVDGTAEPGREIGLRIDQTLTQDATGTMVMLELEAMDLDRVKTELSVQYVDHNLIQEDHKNPDDHLFLLSACERFGVWYSRAGNGVSHPVHQEWFGIPGKTLLGADSHTPAGGAIGMLAIGTGGLDVAMAMVGEPYHVKMPEVWGVRLVGELPEWVSAKDVVLEMLRRHDVDGAVNCVLEYHGPGLDSLSAMDRHVIANMGTELGATSTVFPSDQETKRYLERHGRGDDWIELVPDEGATYDRETELDLSQIEPLAAMPSSPGNVVPVTEIAGRDLKQAYIGSSANPGFRDFAIAAEIVKDRKVDTSVSFDVNPTSRGLLERLSKSGHLLSLLEAGARLHQAGCNGCIGMGQAPATDTLSLRTVPRNFPGRSGTREDQVVLCSPETAAVSALFGKVTDPRTIDRPYPRIEEPNGNRPREHWFQPPFPEEEARRIELRKGPNIASIPDFEGLPAQLELPVLLKADDDISTDEILPAGTRVLPFRSNIPKISEFAFDIVDETYAERAKEVRENGGHTVVGGENYGQGSSREHAALAPRYLGLRAVLAKSFARIHWQNLVNFGVLPLRFAEPADYENISRDDTLKLTGLDQLADKETLDCQVGDRTIQVVHDLSPRQVEVLAEGGLVNWVRRQGG